MLSGEISAGVIELGLSGELGRRLAPYRDRSLSTNYAREFEVIVDRKKAGCSTWYEMFLVRAAPPANSAGH